MKIAISAIALLAGLSLTTSAFAQDTPSGGPDAKGNAPLKHMHTVNDGSAKRGANSFTQNEAKKHILHSGYTDVSALTKGSDGVWRGTATKDGSSRSVALDFKGNVSEGGPVAQADQAAKATGAQPRPVVSPGAPTPAPASSPAPESSAEATPVTHPVHHAMHRHHHRHRHHMMAKCANPGPNGVACSGRDRNMNGISDKEDRALKSGVHP